MELQALSPDLLIHIAGVLHVSMKGLVATIELLDEGSTVPFIARYRKEATALASAPASAELPTRTGSTVLVLVDSVDLAVVKALRYARSLRPSELRAVHLMTDSLHAEHLRTCRRPPARATGQRNPMQSKRP